MQNHAGDHLNVDTGFNPSDVAEVASVEDMYFVADQADNQKPVVLTCFFLLHFF